MSEPKKDAAGKMTPGTLFAYFAAVGIGLILLAMGAEPLFNFSRSISMSFDLLTKPILLLVVVGGLAMMFFSEGKKGKPDGGDASPKKDAEKKDDHH